MSAKKVSTRKNSSENCPCLRLRPKPARPFPRPGKTRPRPPGKALRRKTSARENGIPSAFAAAKASRKSRETERRRRQPKQERGRRGKKVRPKQRQQPRCALSLSKPAPRNRKRVLKPKQQQRTARKAWARKARGPKAKAKRGTRGTLPGEGKRKRRGCMK